MEHLRKLTHFFFSVAIVLALGLMVAGCEEDHYADVEDQIDITLNTDDDGKRANPIGGGS